MTGTDTPQREAVPRVTLRGPTGQEQEIDAVVDTGFTGYVTLPSSLIATLRLPFHSPTVATLADGSLVRMAIYEANILWDGQLRDVLVLEASGDYLLGMSLLHGFRLAIDVVDGGGVSVTRLP